LSLRANFSWIFIGNVVYAGCQWGILVVLAKLGSPEMVGMFGLGLAITAPVIMFASLKTRTVQATDAKHDYLFGDYLGLRLITTVLALLVVVGIVLVAGYHREVALVILAVGLAKSFESISDAFYGLLQQHERMDRIAKSMMIRGPLSLAALGIGVYVTGSVFWGVMGLVSVWALVLVYYDVRSGALMVKSLPQLDVKFSNPGSYRTRLHPRWDRQTLVRLAWLALPLGLVGLLSSLHSNIPRYFIEQSTGMSGLGIFVALAYFDRVGNLIVHALGRSASPRLAQYYAAERSAAFRRLLFKLTGIGVMQGIVSVLVVLVAGEEILTLFYRPEYAQQNIFLRLMVAAGMAFVASFLIDGVTAARHFRVQVFLYGFVTITLVLACYYFIPSGGLLGAANALIIARGVQLIGSLIIAIYILLVLDRQTRMRTYKLDNDSA
jgi:O-antigen/teichoic acid export membrane protein